MAVNKVSEFPIERLKIRRLIAAAANGEITIEELEKKLVLDKSDIRMMVSNHRLRNCRSIWRKQ